MVMHNWDDVYDPSRPNSYDAYKHSEEKIREVREWKDRLYAHRMARRTSNDMDSEDEYSRRPTNSKFTTESRALCACIDCHFLLGQFAPPSQFAPPQNLNDLPPENRAPRSPEPHYVPPPTATMPDDPTGDDAYTRRLRLSQNVSQAPPIQPVQPSQPPPPPPPPPPAASQSYAAATISRAPVRYTLPPAPEDIPATEAELEAKFANETTSTEENFAEDGPRSLRPGQEGFAERLMKKYGWTKGTGLGAARTGIVKPLQVKMEKQKKKPDSEGGRFVTPGGRGKIVGPKQSQSEEGKFGPMSEVVILYGMVDGLDLDVELSREDGGLLQEIGDECGEKVIYARRIYRLGTIC